MSKRSRKDGRWGRRRESKDEPSQAEAPISGDENVQAEIIDIEVVDQGTPGVTITGVEEASKRPVRKKRGRRRPHPGGDVPSTVQRRKRRPPLKEKPFMSISLIAAVAQNDVIGRDGDLPWDLPNDREFFKKVTMGHAVIMGRKTFETMGVLEGRANIVISKNEDYEHEGVTVVHDIVDALIVGGSVGGEVFVAGGAEIYDQFLPLAEKMYLTRIQGGFAGDVRFPKIFWEEWERTDSKVGKRDADNKLHYSFDVFER